MMAPLKATDISFDDLLLLAYEEPYMFGIWAGFEDITLLHNEWIKDMIFGDEDRTLLAHRESYKTTCVSVALALSIVLFPNDNLIFTRKTDTDVQEIVHQVASLLLTDSIQTLSLGLYGVEIKLVKHSGTEINTNLKRSISGHPQLLGLGIKTSWTGKHAGKIFTDDIVNIEDRISRAERERIKLQYQELQNVRNREGRIFNTATKWHKNDAIEELMPNHQIFDCYSTGLLTQAQIQHKRKSMSPSFFAANYELKHIADEDSMFTSPTIDDGTNTERIFNGICHVDAAYGGADSTAFTIFKEAEKGGTIYGYGNLWDKHVDDVLPTIEKLRKHYRAGTLYLEDNADKGYLKQKVRRPAKGYHESMNKYIKISTYLRENWNRIVWIKETDTDYLNQILDYTENAEHDDAPDSAASLLRKAIVKKSNWMY